MLKILLNNLQKIFGPILAKTFTLEKCIKIFKLCQQDWKSDRSAKLKSGSKIHESMNAGFELNN